MTAYILRRIVHAVPIILGVALVTFVIFHFAGGDPVLALAGKHATVQEVEALRHEYGFDRPLPIQFLRFVKQIVTLDFDRSFHTKQTIGTMLADGAGVSLSLTALPFLVTVFLSVLLALFSAAMHRRFLDRFLVVTCVFGMSVPFLAYILFGQYILAYHFNLFPISGYESLFPDRIRYLLLPWIIYVVVSVGYDTRFFRTVFLEELGKDYVRTATAKGASRARVLLVHVLPNALVPIITRVVIEIPFLFLGILLLENFFGIPGLGNLLYDALNNADWPVIQAMVVLGSVLYIVGNLVSDILYAWVDPRVRLG
ncbi:MAG: ABC transporter permease [Pseudomonadota bacterium]